jgi:two-component system chemotaxis response regulator CheY
MNVLVVDDSRIMRNIVKNCLLANKRFQDVEFHDAADGVEAAAMLEKIKVDLLLLDWNMPRLNGLDLVKKLRADTKYDRLPIIMVTSEAAKYNVIEAVKAGVNDYLIKPVSEKNLMEKIDRVM